MTEGVSLIYTIPWHDENKLILFTQNTSPKRAHNTCNLPLSSPQCSVHQAEVTVSLMSRHVSTCLSLHSLAVCDCTTLFVMIKFLSPHYV